MQDWTESNEVMVSGEDLLYSEPSSSQVWSQHDGMDGILCSHRCLYLNLVICQWVGACYNDWWRWCLQVKTSP